MIRRVFRAATPLAACAALALPALTAQAAPALQDFPRASPVRYAGSPVLVTAVSSISTAEGGAPLQIAALGDILAYGQASSPMNIEPAAAAQAPDGDTSVSSEALPMLAGLACIAAFVMARRSRS